MENVRKKRVTPTLPSDAEKSCVAALSGWASFKRIKQPVGGDRERERSHQASPTSSLTHHWGYITKQSENQAVKRPKRKWKSYGDDRERM